MDVAAAEEDDEEAAMQIAMAMSLGAASAPSLSTAVSASANASEGYSDMPDSGVPPGFTGTVQLENAFGHPISSHCFHFNAGPRPTHSYKQQFTNPLSAYCRLYL